MRKRYLGRESNDELMEHIFGIELGGNELEVGLGAGEQMLFGLGEGEFAETAGGLVDSVTAYAPIFFQGEELASLGGQAFQSAFKGAVAAGGVETKRVGEQARAVATANGGNDGCADDGDALFTLGELLVDEADGEFRILAFNGA